MAATRVARFFLAQHAKTGKNIPKRLHNIQNYHRISIPNAHKIYQKAIMYNQNFWDFG
jgi:hypothetical protein